ncbi:hypothetical protein SUNI508_06642 [Seiridium unicorne]|uniref:Uncharacterized protein n=1 Tax=Seiridium unicorne TaxID=138068 RepID=A0ABR2UZZ0_9PEZI
MVAFLLVHGANPNIHDLYRATHQNAVWFPIHWALSCGCWNDPRVPQKRNFDPVPVEAEIVRLLLQHGADPNQPTFDYPKTGPADATNSCKSADAEYALNMSICDHVLAKASGLLMEAGAKAEIEGKEFACFGHSICGLWSPFTALIKTSVLSESCDRKLMMLAQRTGEAKNWIFDGDNVRCPMTQITPTRIELLHVMLYDKPQVTVFGVYAFLELWSLQKKVALQAAGNDMTLVHEDMILQRLEQIIQKLLGVANRAYAEEEGLDVSDLPDLPLYFADFCRSPRDSALDDFVKILEDRGFYNTS